MSGLMLAVLVLGAQAEGPLMPEDGFRVSEVSENAIMVEGFGGNSTIISTSDGVFLVDTMMSQAGEGLNALIIERFGQSPRAAVNTHHHNDHSTGNGAFNEAGSLVFGHEFLRNRIANRFYSDRGERWVEPRPLEQIPTATYVSDVSFYWGDHAIRILHPGPAHTGGDSIVYVLQENIISTGDIFVNGIWPIIDVYAGGSVDGTIAALMQIHDIANDETVIVPGHGPLASRNEVMALHDRLAQMRDVTRAAISEGVSREDFTQSDPFLAISPDWQAWFIDSVGVAGLFYDDFAIED